MPPALGGKTRPIKAEVTVWSSDYATAQGVFRGHPHDCDKGPDLAGGVLRGFLPSSPGPAKAREAAPLPPSASPSITDALTFRIRITP
jgi:hypothetical protein